MAGHDEDLGLAPLVAGSLGGRPGADGGDPRGQVSHVCPGRETRQPALPYRWLGKPEHAVTAVTVRLDERHHYDIEVASGEVCVLARIGPLHTAVASRPVPTGSLILRIEVATVQAVNEARTGPDILCLGFEEPDGTFVELTTLDGRYLSTEVAGGSTGRVMGMYASAGTVHVDWFDYESLGP
ncbi:hypothetical protein [Streptomyces violaceusniger]|uniref:Beta-xylosidase C-terminal Concanavalin A-like domain-containing protein n=1 Tax=Streptomyces violaceusniger TaxID=68280 RepID=A0A4D4KTY2_STRVO|nr:hypothetical protein SVIO_005500 [Streptomyces violaceusniger]